MKMANRRVKIAPNMAMKRKMMRQLLWRSLSKIAMGAPASNGPIAPKNCPQPIKKAKYFFGNQFNVTTTSVTKPNDEPKPIINRLMNAGIKLSVYPNHKAPIEQVAAAKVTSRLVPNWSIKIPTGICIRE